MNNNISSNEKEYLVQRIRTQYTEKQHTELDELTALDKRVRRPANIFACIFGAAAALIMGAGMSLVMTDIGRTVGLAEPMAPGIAVGVVGMLMAIVNYPIYKGTLARRRKKYAQQVIALSDRIMKN